MRVLVEAEHDVAEQDQHQERDADRYRQKDRVVQPLDVAGDRARRRKEADLPRLGRAEQRRVRGARRARGGPCRDNRPKRESTLVPSLLASRQPPAPTLFAPCTDRMPASPFCCRDITPHR